MSDHSAPLRLSLARLVARPGARAGRLGARNELLNWVRLEEAVDADFAFTVEVRYDVLALDDDSEELGHAAEQLRADLKGRGLSPVLVASGTAGRRHLFAVVPDPGLHRELRALGRAIGLDVRESIRPPLTRHRLGGWSELLDPRDPGAALAALSIGYVPEAGALSQRIPRILRYGDERNDYPLPDGTGTDRSRMLHAVVIGMVNARWPDSQIHAALLHPVNRGGEKAQEILERRGWPAARAYIDLSIGKARKLRELPTRDQNVDARLSEIERAALSIPPDFAGAAGGTDLLVLLAHITIARRVLRLRHGAAVREIAELALVGRTSVSKAHRRLVSAGWLERLPRPGLSATTTWLLTLPTSQESPDGTVKGFAGGCEECPEIVTGARASVWRPEGLGNTALRIWLVLAGARTAVNSFAERLSIGQKTILGHLEHLEAHGLAMRRNDGWVSGPTRPEDLDLVDPRTGRSLRDLVDDLHLRHDRERQRYEAWQAARRQREWPEEHPGT